MTELEAGQLCYAIYGPNQTYYPGRFILVSFTFQDGEAVEDEPPIASARFFDELLAIVPRDRIRVERRPGDHEALICSFI